MYSAPLLLSPYVCVTPLQPSKPKKKGSKASTIAFGVVAVFVLGASTVQSQQDQTKKPTATANGAPNRASSKPSAQNNLSREYREAAMLARLAIAQWQDKESSDKQIQDRYRDEAEKAVTVAKARQKTAGDAHLSILIDKLNSMVNGMYLIAALKSLRDLNGGDTSKETNGHDYVQRLFSECDTHVEVSLTSGRYNGDGPCARWEQPPAEQDPPVTKGPTNKPPQHQ
jgi:hypothetical protein